MQLRAEKAFEIFRQALGTENVPHNSAAFSVKYPAHLHIDILPEYQGQKVGTALMSALKEKLVSDNIKGVMLCVGKGNMRAIEFYKKNGFKVIFRLFGAVFMGLNLPQS